jgi:DNA polymerase-3 subunit gamma/tau
VEEVRVVALALYRKYRPRTFAEVIGQEHVTEPLSQALRSGRLHHAYLFSGPRGCGKTSSARILARSLNCAEGPTPEPCGRCESCVALAPDGPGSIDVIEIDAASHGGVDDARDLRERAFFAPVASRFKVYVIDEAHMVSTQGFNALLKLVEEPPEYVTFIFATTEPEKVLGTIRSRTHHYPFRLIPSGVLRPYLEQLCREEGVAVEPAVFPLVVRAGAGSARDSLSVLDQLIAGAGPEGVSYARAVALLGVTDVVLIDEMTDALAAGDGAAAFATVDRVADAGHDPRRYAGDLLERLRDLIVLQRVPDAVSTGIIDAPADQLERMTAQAARIGAATVSRLADIVHNGLTEMRGTTAPRLLLELMVARMLLPGADDSHGALLHRLERMERRLGAASAESSSTMDGSGYEPSVHSGSSVVGRPAAPVSAVIAGVAGSAGMPATAGSIGLAGSTRPLGASGPAGASGGAAAARSAAAAASRSVGPSGASQTSRASGGALRADRPQPGPVAPVSGTPASVTPVSAVPVSAAPVSSSPVSSPPGSLDAAGVRRVWDEVLAVVRRRSPVAWAVIREASVRDVQGEQVVLLFQHAAHATMFTAQADLLAEALREVLGGTWSIRSELGGRAPDQGYRPSEAPPARPSGPAGRSEPAAGRRETTAGRSEPARPARQPERTDAADQDWPEPARPGEAGGARGSAGGQSPAQPSAQARTTTQTRAPAQSRPAGAARTGGTAPPAGQTGSHAGAGAQAGAQIPAQAQVRAPDRGAPARAATPAGKPAAGKASTGAGASSPARSGSARGAQARSGTRTSGRPFSADEPPFDPDYDRVAPDGFEGFDPGDEPIEGEAGAVHIKPSRQITEEQAIRLLTEELGAEPIG